jgi:diguanylate cyclase (GGDEF)-like protein/PAS domain S-box-containing protein
MEETMDSDERPDRSRTMNDGKTGIRDETFRMNDTKIESINDVLPENYRSCLDAIPDLMCLKGGDLEYVFVNKAFCELLDVKPTDVLGKRSTHMFPKEVGRKLETMDLLVLATSKSVEEEVKIGDRLFEMRKFPVSFQDAGLVMVSGRDITERKQAEQALLTDKIRFQILSDNAPLGMLLLDGNGSVKYANTRFRDLFGYDPEDIPDGSTWFRRVFPGREFENDLAAILTRADEVKGWSGKERQTLTATRRDGTQEMVSLEAVRLTSGDIVVSCDDVAERAIIENKVVSRVDYDLLTGLPNRLSMERATRIAVDHAKEAKKRRGFGALLFIEVEEFEVLSEKQGRFTADQVISSLGKMLKGILRSGDNAYRLAGGQFGVVFKGIAMAEARLAAERIQKIMNSLGFQVGREKIRLTTAVTLLQIDGKEEPTELFQLGSKMLTEARKLGLNQIIVRESARRKEDS